MSGQFNLTLKVKGNALAPRLRDGECVIVDTRIANTDDDVVLVAKEGSTNVFCL